MSGIDVVPDTEAERRGGAPPRPLRIMVVDDNKPFAETLSWVLEGGGDKLEIAYNGPAALELARRFGPDIVFLDIVLPVVDGYEVCKLLRAQSNNPALKIIALSGFDDTSVEAEKRGACFDFHFTKPLDIRQIVVLMGRIRRGYR